MSRTVPAFLQRPLLDASGQPMRLFLAGANWTRTSWTKDPVSGLYLPGVLLEPERVQNARYSRAQDSWTLTRCTVPTTDATAPDASATADVLHEDATAASTHYSTASTTAALAAGTTYVCSTYVKAINRNWFGIGLASAYAYFNLSTGELGTPTGCTNYIEDVGDGWYRVWIVYTETSSVVRTIYAYIAEADGDITFDGLDQDDYYIWGYQVEAGLYPSSQIINDGTSSVTRTADSALIYGLGAEMARRQWTLLVPVVVPSHRPGADLKLFSVYKNGAASTDHVTAWVDTSGQLKVTSACTGSSAGSLTVSKSIADGNLHWLSVHARHGQLHAIVDSWSVAADADAGIAADLDRCSVEPSGAWVGGMHMWPSFKEQMPRPVQPQLLDA